MRMIISHLRRYTNILYANIIKDFDIVLHIQTKEQKEIRNDVN